MTEEAKCEFKNRKYAYRSAYDLEEHYDQASQLFWVLDDLDGAIEVLEKIADQDLTGIEAQQVAAKYLSRLPVEEEEEE